MIPGKFIFYFNKSEILYRIPEEKHQNRTEKIAILHEKLKHLYEERYGSKRIGSDMVI